MGNAFIATHMAVWPADRFLYRRGTDLARSGNMPTYCLSRTSDTLRVRVAGITRIPTGNWMDRSPETLRPLTAERSTMSSICPHVRDTGSAAQSSLILGSCRGTTAQPAFALTQPEGHLPRRDALASKRIAYQS